MAWILCAMGLIALAMCLVVLVSTAIKGHPGVGDEGCFLCRSEASAGIVPEDSLVIFEECDLHAVGEGSALVYRAPAGISLGRLYKTSNDYAAIIGADADTVTVVPSSAVLGVAVRYNVVAGRVLSAFADVGGFGTALGLLVTLVACVSLIRGSRGPLSPYGVYL